MKFLLTFLLAGAVVHAADLPPDKGNEIPESSKRPLVVTIEKTRNSTFEIPKADLPEGHTLSLAAASPLVTHPIMGCLDDKGRLFMGDGVGVNWNKAQLEANPPNCVLMLEDTDNDGSFDKSTIFADKMTFPQGAAWLNGSLYVCSPPGLWKLTDTDNDGVADKREMIVSGFDYTGNAADVHGPFLHPNGRLYWCHGRKGHKATDRDGKVVHEGLACGIWSCKPDGRDLQWHSLGCGDNPVEVDFTPDGDIIGVQNLYYTNPRGDTLVHWLYGGVYERSDQLKAIEGLPRTLEHMPVMYNFGHVAVSGSCFWKSAPMKSLQFMVTHFNTQRLVRMDLTPEGSTYKATENEFLKLHNPDVHFTDVMEDPRDGSLLVVDTGGWFRIGCPSSLMAKSELLGAIYRVKGPHRANVELSDLTILPTDSSRVEAMLASKDAFVQRRACDAIAQMDSVSDKVRAAVISLLDRDDPALEHAAMHAVITKKLARVGDLRTEEIQAEISTLREDAIGSWCNVLLCLEAQQTVPPAQLLEIALSAQKSHSPWLCSVAVDVALRQPGADAAIPATFKHNRNDRMCSSWESVAPPLTFARLISEPVTQQTITTILTSDGEATDALQAIANYSGALNVEMWIDPMLARLDRMRLGELPLLFAAAKKLKTNHFDAKLQAIANDAKQPQAIRLKALDAMSTRKITGETFTMVLDVLTKPESSASAKIQAATMMAHSGHAKDERLALSKAFATVGPIELKELLALIKPSKEDEVLRAMATELAKNPSLISQQESIYRTAFADKPTEIFETIVLPAYRKAYEAIDAKKRTLSSLADKATSVGDATAGKVVFESGRGTCIACHQIGDKGRSIGPNLSKIGAIRTERDLMESILFPSNTLARDYEAHIIETAGGETITGVIKSHTAEGLLVVDVAGQEKSVPHGSITGNTTLTMSLMPMGLDMTVPEKDLLDLVAYLRSCK